MGSPRERPILFADAMVRRLLAGEKTQTRRAIHPSLGERTHSPVLGLDALWRWMTGRVSHVGDERRCPYGMPGDRLWVRETWCEVVPSAGVERRHPDDAHRGVRYRATWDRAHSLRWRPSLHMERWASRLTLEVTDVRVQRLQDISEEDAKAEGARYFGDLPSTHPYGLDARWSMEEPTSTEQCLGTARHAFGSYVNQLHGGPRWNCNGLPQLWDLNPWVWAVSFRRVEAAR